MPVIYMDLDGTLLDVWPRYYSVMKQFVEHLEQPFPSLEEYKQLKLTKIQDADILQTIFQDDPERISELLPSYTVWKRRMLEQEELLRLDSPIGSLEAFAQRAGPAYKLQLISIRRNPGRAMRQLERLQLIGWFDRIEFISPSGASNPKGELIHERAAPDDLFIGDSETDIACGAALGLRTFHVGTGLRSFDYATRAGKAIQLETYADVLSFI
ncbi:HAD family hydrolase [Paenibacillus puerhi]|uniref:HAD family hydrolase n=1 Tax=Paenibacillus puerhi TaxID=2692622 RepID=UPI0013568700|nr:HAD hydrolase-like protein [Paenibacillus puerhi]